MPRPEFEIEIQPNGLCDVRRRRKAFAYDLDDVDEALSRIRRKYGRDIPVTIIQIDGYRTRAHT